MYLHATLILASLPALLAAPAMISAPESRGTAPLAVAEVAKVASAGNAAASTAPSTGAVGAGAASGAAAAGAAGSGAAAAAGGACQAAATAADMALGQAAAEQELEINAAFGDQVALGGGDVKTDVFYPPSATGFFEIEFQNTDARTLTVTENKTPAAPPAGFLFVESSSFIVSLAGGTEGLTLQKVDYFFDVTNPAVAGLGLAQTVVGKLSADGCSFVVNEALGELEFEAEENELTLTVDDLNGEWGIFIPQAAVAKRGAKRNAKRSQ